MMTLVAIVAVMGLLMMLSAVGAGVFMMTRPTSTSTPASSRSKLMELASKAASDDQGHAVFQLLATLEAGGEGQAVAVRWWPHRPADDRPSGLMLTITWDGNEWRRVLVPSLVLAPYTLAATQSPTSDAGTRLLADLQAA